MEKEDGLSVLSTVADLDVLSGVEFTKSRLEWIRLGAMLSQFQLEPFDQDSDRKAAELRGELVPGGRSPSAPAAMIAGQALARGDVLFIRDRNLANVASPSGVSVVTY